MSVHKKLSEFKKWVEVDIVDSPIRKKVLNIIESDNEKDSPGIIKNIDGKYSPYRPHLSGLAKTQLDMIKLERKFKSTVYVTLAAVKFKKLLNKSNS